MDGRGGGGIGAVGASLAKAAGPIAKTKAKAIARFMIAPSQNGQRLAPFCTHYVRKNATRVSP